MNKDIYTLLNEIDSQADAQTFETADPVEIKRWKQAFRTRKNGAHVSENSAHTQSAHHWGRYAAAAAAAFVLVLSAGPAGQIVYAQAKAIVYSLSDLLGIKKDLSPYRTVVGQSITKNGTTITLNDVILDHETLLVSYSTTAPEALTSPDLESNYMGDCDVYLNGKQISIGASGSSWKEDDYTLISCLELEIPNIDVSKSMDIELNFFLTLDHTPVGSFAFSASGETLMAETRSVALNKTYLLPDQTELTFTRYTSNSLGQRIYFETARDRCDYLPSLKGTDDLGNEISFSLRYFGEGKGRLETDQLNGYIDENASVLTLTPYVSEVPKESGRERDACVAIAALTVSDKPSVSTEDSAADITTGETDSPSTDDISESVSGTSNASERISGTPFIIDLK